MMLARNYLKARLSARVVVHTTDRQSIDGVLREVAKDGVVLLNARYLDAPDGPEPLHGDVYIPRERVAFVQVREGEL